MTPRSSVPKTWILASAAGALVLLTALTGAVLTLAPGIADTVSLLEAAAEPPVPTSPVASPELEGPATAAPAVAPAAPDPAGVPTMLILDASGSMVRDVPTGGTRMDAARAAATTLLDGLDPQARLGLTVFGTGTGNSDAERAAGCSDVTVLQPVGPVDAAAYSASVAGIVESGFTPIGPALRSAADQLPTGEPATIVLVSDGVDTCSPPSSCDVAAEVLAERPLLSIEVIGFAVDADEQAQSQLQCIATLGSGSYVDASDADQLAARLRAATASGDLVTAEGYGRARLGMTLEQARFALEGFTVTGTTAEVVLVDCADAVLEFRGGVLTLITPKAPTATAEGITKGVDVSAATALYGAPSAPVRSDDGWSVDYASAPGSAAGYRVVYDGPDDGTVSGRILRILVCTCGPSVTESSATGSLVSSWQVSLDAVGPIRLGDTFDELGSRIALNDDDVPEGCTWYRDVDTGSPAVAIGVASWPDAEVPQVTSVTIWAPSAFAAAPRSWRDAGFGSSLSQVLAAHPDAAVVRDEFHGDYAVVGGPSGSSLFFLLDSDYVRGIVLSESPELPYEICL
ncbi:VWA domain-containing protein [Rathayibacter caricis]|uniref:VWA domain-containing protein n=1 Tax=Rathayibacter caricis TaxID=110936 RepID=UPI001FB4D6FF|nr:VWA domain-containing protein [Rathayibacter caricis]MCJ1696295.1 VWA domain-containing protein [Rathayibacter caricis]